MSRQEIAEFVLLNCSGFVFDANMVQRLLLQSEQLYCTEAEISDVLHVMWVSRAQLEKIGSNPGARAVYIVR